MDKNKDIFISILDNHKGIIYKVANAYCKDLEDKKDLIQEISLQIWQSLDKYNPQFKLSTWLYRIALNTAISYYRKNKTRKENTVSIPAIFEIGFTPETSFEDRPNVLLLQQFIQTLKELDKALILLYLDGLSNKEIAKIMGITPTNVSTKVGRIKEKLKQKFKTIKY